MCASPLDAVPQLTDALFTVFCDLFLPVFPLNSFYCCIFNPTNLSYYSV